MANEDSFIDEVNEEVRRDQLYAMFRRYGWIAVVFVIVLVGGASWNEYRKATLRTETQERGDAVLAALEAGDATARRDALAAVDSGDDPDTAALIALMVAAADANNGETAQAAQDLFGIASSADTSPVYRDLAVLKSVIADGANMPADERIAALEPLALPGAPFSLLAQEQIAFAEADRGNTDVAVEKLNALLQNAEASDSLRRRAAQLIVALGGTPAI